MSLTLKLVDKAYSHTATSGFVPGSVVYEAAFDQVITHKSIKLTNSANSHYCPEKGNSL